VPGGLVEASRLDDLFEGADLAEIRYLMGRARRTRLASNQIDLTIGGKTLPVNVTVSAIEDQWRLSFIIVLEDMSEVLRVQRMEAWQEVARSVAHEIRNPLTPIALSAERIVRQLEKAGPEAGRVIRECAETINGEVASLKSLVDEFAQAARFPAAQPQTTDLNELIEHALAVFEGRLSGVQVIQELDPQLPLVEVDREQFKRVLVNLIDNAAEAMATTPVKRLLITTRSVDGQAVELVVADTGCGISSEDKEKLFLPYFSTKNRGTGLGLAIVNHILTEHHATIRVEDNRPSGAAFLVEVPLSAAEGVTV
jgi:nitrogen fixation/metabolism regulation signal transduction histidine kinase